MKKKIILFAITIALFASPLISKASDAFTIYFFYDTKANILSFDKFVPENVIHDTTKDISIVEFAQNKTSGEFILELYEADGKKIVSTEFNKQDGAFNLSIPYFSLATGLKVLEKSDNKELLSTNLSKFSVCNGNSICEYEKGETAQNCLGDCATSKPEYSQQTTDLLNKNNGVIKDPVTGQILLTQTTTQPAQQSVSQSTTSSYSIIIIIIIIVIFFALLWIIYKKFIKKT